VVKLTQRQCLYCDNSAGSREHLFPDWLNEVIGETSPTVFLLGSNRKGFRVWRKDQPASHTLRVVCDGCNTGWMSKFEGVAKPILTPMILGTTVTLDADAQRIASAWAFGRAVIGEHLTPAEVAVPADHRNWLRDTWAQDGAATVEAPSAASVFTAATDPNTWPPGHGLRGNVHFSDNKMMIDQDQTQVLPSLVKGARIGYAATILVSHLALQVVGKLLPEDMRLGHQAAFGPYLTRIWPNTGSQIWPSGQVMGLDAVEALITEWKGTAPRETPWAPPHLVYQANRGRPPKPRKPKKKRRN
jgi:hypothetical protein